MFFFLHQGYPKFSFEINVCKFSARSKFQFKAKKKNTTIEFNVGKSCPEIIKTDSIKLKQILTNLITNAIKYTSEKGTITVRAGILNENPAQGSVLKAVLNKEGDGLDITLSKEVNSDVKE